MSIFSKIHNVFPFHKYLPIAIIGVLFLLTVLQWHNIHAYPVNRGLDTEHHIAYINYLKTYRLLPQPYEGWEMWQPPLYYSMASFFPTLHAVRYLHFLGWILLTCMSFIFFHKQFKSKLKGLLGTLITLSTPIFIYTTPPISNEFISAVIIMTAMIFYLVVHKKLTGKKAVILGILLGISLLAKATSLILVATIIIHQLIRIQGKNSSLKQLLIVLSIMTLIGGWFYIRNMVLYQNPFIASIDFPQWSFKQPPEDRSLGFFLNISPFFRFDLFQAHHYSFLGGTLFSWFYDGHNVLIPVQPFSKAGALLIIMSLPMVIFFIRGILHKFKEHDDTAKFCKIYIFLLFLAYLIYNLKIPYYSTVKSVYLISMVIPVSYFIMEGIAKSSLKYPLISGYVFLYSLLVVKNFWILSHWYR